MNNDSHLLFEAYKKSLSLNEDAEHVDPCTYAKEGCTCNGCKACRANQSKNEDSEEELGPDPKEADELEAIVKKHGNGSFFKDEPRHEPDYKVTPFWNAYKAVLAGQWSEDDFHQWCQTVWNAGSEEGNRPPEGSEDAESSSRYDDPYREKENHKYDRGEERSDREYESSRRETWYVILPNGKIFARDGKPAPFTGQDAANKAAVTMSKQPFNIKKGIKIQDFKLTKNPDIK
jgi:hypothetical protein